MDEEDAAKRLLRELMEKHPNASQAELMELFKEAVMDNEDAKRAIIKFWMARRDMH